MKPRDAIKILMLSPFYFKMSLTDRRQLVKEFCQIHASLYEAPLVAR